MNNIISIEHITKKFKHKSVLEDISFEIPEGSIFAFLGSNGAGKSTLLNIIVQILLPTSGKILMNNGKIKKEDIGVVFQENTLDDDFTIYENLLLRGSLYNINKKVLHHRIIRLSKKLGIFNLLNKKYKECSLGQKRLVTIIRALLMNPKIIVMDEATTALDIETRKKVWEFLLNLNKEEKLTIFFSSHYLEEAEVATNLCILKNGKIIFNGKYQELIEKYSKKQLRICINGNNIKKEVSTAKFALNYLEGLDLKTIDTFSLLNSNLEEIFLKLISNESIS